MGKASSPPAPDFTGAANATAEGNLANIRAQTQANRVNTYTPYGSLTYTNGGTFDQAGYDAAMAAYNTPTPGMDGTQVWVPATGTGGPEGEGSGGYWQTSGGTIGSQTTGTMPDRAAFMSGNPDQWTSTVTLSPEQQALLDQQNETSMGMANLQGAGLDRVSQQMAQGFNTSGLPAAGQAFNASQAPNMGRTIGMGEGPQQGRALNPNSLQRMGSALNQGTLPGMGTTLNRDSLASMGTAYNPNAATNTATEAIMSRLRPEFEKKQNALNAQLANQGITAGSEAYTNDQTALGQQQNDAYTQAALQGINLGMAQQGQTFGQQMDRRNQGLNEQGIQYGQQMGRRNQAVGEQDQRFGQLMGLNQQEAANQAQRFGQQSSLYDQYGNRQAQQYGQQMGRRGLFGSEQAQTFGQSEQARQQAIQEQAYLRQLPLNELNALRTGAQVTNPTFSNSPQQGYTPGPDLMGAASNTYNAQMQGVNAQNANAGNFMNGLFSLGGAALGAPTGTFRW